MKKLCDFCGKELDESYVHSDGKFFHIFDYCSQRYFSMTVKDLIENLKKYPENAKIICTDAHGEPIALEDSYIEYNQKLNCIML